jgi:DNA-directed RNA polymerase specialized sigma24 family protein
MAGETSSDANGELLILRMAGKDEEALRLFLETYGGKLRGFLTSRYGDVLKAQEIDAAVNATAFNVWRFAHRYTAAKGSPKAWFIRVARNAVVSILRGENRNRAQDLGYDPADAGPEGGWRVRVMEHVIENELTGLEQAVARADLVTGGSANAGRLAALHGTNKDVIYSTRSRVRAKIRKRIQEHEGRPARPKGKP